jgi:hypothetical protein
MPYILVVTEQVQAALGYGACGHIPGREGYGQFARRIGFGLCLALSAVSLLW